jgi:hypothetical protein
MAATYAGSKTRPPEISELIADIQKTFSDIASKVDNSAMSGQGTLQRQLGLMLSRRVRLLLVFANPKGTSAIRLQDEQRAIRDAISRSKAKNNIHVDVLPATRVDDLRRALLAKEYDIVHFSGHGGPGTLCFETEEGNSIDSPLLALAELVSRYPLIKCVVLNSCSSLAQLIEVAPITIGMEKPVDDADAIEFARGFYDALAAGREIDFAVEEGKSAAKMKALPGASVKILISKDTAKGKSVLNTVIAAAKPA